MRIMLVAFRFGRDIPGGAERYLWELAARLTQAGHDVEVFTTCSLQMLRSQFGYMVWDNYFPEGKAEDNGVVINRYPVHNPTPRRARRWWDELSSMHEKESRKPGFISHMSKLIEGREEHCFLSGWHAYEQRDYGQARWSKRQAFLLASGEGITDLWLQASSQLDQLLALEVSGVKPIRVNLEKGRVQDIHAAIPARDGIVVGLKVPKTSRPPEDGRDLGVLVQGVRIKDKGGERELDISRGWAEFVKTAPEDILGEALWWMAGRMPKRASRMHKYVMGPRSPLLERGVRSSAAGFDIIIGSMAPMTSLSMAAEVADRCGKPFVAFPLFHSRDPNHYFDHLYHAMTSAWGVEANLLGIADIMTAWGLNAFAVGPGFNLEELLSEDIDGSRFRRRFGLEGVPLILWVARKNPGKGYQEAMAALEFVRDNGCPAELVMIGPDEDYLPVSGEGVHYLGPLRREVVLDAYDACDIFMFPSLHESFCLVFGEAWLRGKPVLGNAYCAAARGNILHGEDGYLCYDQLEYGQRALELLRNPSLAREMGQRGRDKVMNMRGWDRIIEELEGKLEEAAGLSRA
jgi:glycosyltransferase involved in cell wall biosynthesis